MQFSGAKKMRGVSILETITAIAIFSIVSLAIFGLSATSLHTSQRSELKLKAMTLAQNILLEQRRVSFEDLTIGTRPAIPVSQSEWKLPSAQSQVEVTAPPQFGGRLKEIAVTITWEFKGQPQTLRRIVTISKILLYSNS